MTLLTPLSNLNVSGIGVLAQVTPDMAELAKTVGTLDVKKVFTVLVIVAVAYAANRVAVAALDRFGEGQAKRRLLFKKISSFTRLGLFVFAAYLGVMTFLDVEENRAALLGLGGTLAVTIGFALKDTASSLMAGILILIDQPFQVGDRVQFQETYGEVKEIGLRSVRIVTLDDNEVSIPNNKFLTESVASANAGALDMMVVITFYIAMTEDFALAKRLVFEACMTSKYVFLHKPVTIVIKDEITPIAFTTQLICKAYVIDARYEMAFITDVTERVKRAFRTHRIHYPYVREFSVRSDRWSDFDNSSHRDS